ncbi:hypothetical protein J19TS2_52580 [Cohnella xylanilytica]|uniref:DUF4432 family protein n=1 Tax=Cohnella xylanilytica TaxID=557555 RepID=UPI001B1E486C|nr:DUF4432 family protein [Cohnella xylanilytica]GIO15703.1 hypothetical protein J19TS2_52580 [Cohnella xylanilytica]
MSCANAAEAVKVEVEGIEAVRLENEWLRAVVLVGKGTDVWELTYKPLAADLLLKTKSGLAPLRGRDLRTDRLTHYAEAYPGGWQDIVPNRARFGGREVDRQREGESAGIPWEYEIRSEGADATLVCRASLPFAPLAIEKTFRLAAGEPELVVTEEVTNVGGEDILFIWTHHPAFASPLVGESARVILPEGSKVFNVWRYEEEKLEGGESRGALEALEKFEEEPGEVRLAGGGRKDLRKVEPPSPNGGDCYAPLFGFREGEAGIRNPALGLQLKLSWDRETFPCLRYWSRNDEDLYTVALEPSTSRFSDIDDAIRRGDCLRLGPGERRPAWIRVRVEPDLGNIGEAAPREA